MPLLDDSDKGYYSDSEERSFVKMKTQMVLWMTRVTLTLARKIMKTFLTLRPTVGAIVYTREVLLFFKDVLARNVLETW